MIELVHSGVTSCVDSSYSINYNNAEVCQVYVCHDNACTLVWSKENTGSVAAISSRIACCSCSSNSTAILYYTRSDNLIAFASWASCTGTCAYNLYICQNTNCVTVSDSITVNCCYDYPVCVQLCWVLPDTCCACIISRACGTSLNISITSCGKFLCTPSICQEITSCCTLSANGYISCYDAQTCTGTSRAALPVVQICSYIDADAICRCVVIKDAASGSVMFEALCPLSCPLDIVY